MCCASLLKSRTVDASRRVSFTTILSVVPKISASMVVMELYN
jgi:hypothetical protein